MQRSASLPPVLIYLGPPPCSRPQRIAWKRRRVYVILRGICFFSSSSSRCSYGIREVTRLLAPLILSSERERASTRLGVATSNGILLLHGACCCCCCSALIARRVSTFNRDVLDGEQHELSSIYANSAHISFMRAPCLSWLQVLFIRNERTCLPSVLLRYL